ncbi:MAG: 30S ribosomal protein S10 [Chlamydiae bacterium RIFCSPHIGHO2_12_FULL_49_11]|nr:MAG: 30S ribosomal protein S10 [Chlamydiae bacterium RIFCSPHIGHO2_12_FULL_49_11]
MSEPKKSKQKIRIRLMAYDHRLIDQVTRDIVDTARRTGAIVIGPIPLPTKIEKQTVIRSPHVDKTSREQFEIRTHKRMIELRDPTAQTVEELKKGNVPAGVHITLQA